MSSITCVMGDPGSGKTRLAGTWPHPFWINLESDGNTTALRGGIKPNGIDVPRGNTAVASVVNVLNEVRGLKPNAEGLIEYRGSTVGSLVVDSVDALQETDKYMAVIPSTRYKSMDERGWGKLADDMWPFAVNLNDLPVPVVVIAHVREREIPGSSVMDVTWNLQGSFKITMNRIFSEILMIIISSDNKRHVLSQPFTTGTRRYTAKDRHGRLTAISTGGKVCIDSADGYPPNDVAAAITGWSGYAGS